MKPRNFIILCLCFMIFGCADLNRAKTAFDQQDYSTAARHWEVLAKRGFPQALIGLGQLKEISKPDDIDTALNFYKKAYRLGDDSAAYYIGQYMFKYGETEEDIEQAHQWILKAAKQGSASAYLIYADMLMQGRGNEANPGSALYIYKKLSEHGYAPATRRLAHIYETGFNVLVDKKTAFDLYTKAFQQGSLESKIDIGRFYLQGYGIAKNLQKAEDIFKPLAHSGNGQAAYFLGELHLLRFATDMSSKHSEIIEWYQRSADLGYVPAKIKLIDFELANEQGNFDQAIKKLYELSLLNEGKASFRLGRLASQGKLSISKGQELEYYKLAYNQGYELAAYRIAQFYTDYGQSELEDEKSRYWLDLALKQKGENALFIQAEMKLKGHVLKKNVEQALSIYKQLSESGMQSASRELGQIYERGLYVPTNLAQALFYYQQAATQGDPHAALDTARFYAEGAGVEQNWNKAKTILLHYADAGFFQASYLLGTYIERQAEPGFPLPAEALSWYEHAASKGYLPARIRIIELMLTGNGMKKDVDGAKAQLTELSQLGNAIASERLAEVFVEENDLLRALYYFQQAFFQGKPQTAKKLAEFYEQGFGVNSPLLIAQFKENVGQGNIESAYLLGIIYNFLGDTNAAVEWYSIAAASNHSESLLELAKIHMKQGQHKQADLWLRKAVLAKNGEAMLIYGENLFHGRYVRKNSVGGLAYVLAAARMKVRGAVRSSMILINRLNNIILIDQANSLSREIVGKFKGSENLAGI